MNFMIFFKNLIGLLDNFLTVVHKQQLKDEIQKHVNDARELDSLHTTLETNNIIEKINTEVQNEKENISNIVIDEDKFEKRMNDSLNQTGTFTLKG